MQLLRVEKVAELLDTSTARVYELIRLRLLPAVRLGRQVRVAQEALDEWVRNGGQPLAGGWRRSQ
ncbi:MAG: helix-turn-helix domain-containing protein [Thermoanaerobaculaceae bacterium]|jgi:excisionase family DNA binding protein